MENTMYRFWSYVYGFRFNGKFINKTFAEDFEGVEQMKTSVRIVDGDYVASYIDGFGIRCEASREKTAVLTIHKLLRIISEQDKFKTSNMSEYKE